MTNTNSESVMESSMDETNKQHFRSGQHAAMRGCFRLLIDAPDEDARDAWYRGYDTVPDELRGVVPLAGPIPARLLNLMELVSG